MSINIPKSFIFIFFPNHFFKYLGPMMFIFLTTRFLKKEVTFICFILPICWITSIERDVFYFTKRYILFTCIKRDICIYCVTCCSCFSQLSLLVPLYYLCFSVFVLLFEYIKLDNSFCYQVLVKVCMFLIIFVFIILSIVCV